MLSGEVDSPDGLFSVASGFRRRQVVAWAQARHVVEFTFICSPDISEIVINIGLSSGPASAGRNLAEPVVYFCSAVSHLYNNTLTFIFTYMARSTGTGLPRRRDLSPSDDTNGAR